MGSFDGCKGVRPSYCRPPADVQNLAICPNRLDDGCIRACVNRHGKRLRSARAETRRRHPERARRILAVARASALLAATGLSRSTLYLLLDSLERRRWIEKVSDGYVIGVRLFELGSGFLRHDALQAAFRVEAAEFVGAHNEVVQLAVLDGTEVVYIARKICIARCGSSRISARGPRRTAARLARRCSRASPTMHCSPFYLIGFRRSRRAPLRAARGCCVNSPSCARRVMGESEEAAVACSFLAAYVGGDGAWQPRGGEHHAAQPHRRAPRKRSAST